MIEQVVSGKNIQKAIRQTISNDGSAGVDGITVSELKEHLQTHQISLFTNIVNEKYRPQAIRGVEIPKTNGKTRLLGVPTVVERMLQQAVSQRIAPHFPHFELKFKEYSYCFRPKRNAHQAIQQAQKYIHEGYGYIVDIDLQNFFDEVDHAILLQLIYRKIKCPVTLRLIRLWLRAPRLL